MFAEELEQHGLSNPSVFHRHLAHAVSSCSKFIQTFLKLLINFSLVTMSTKFFTGAHRPHFFETCKPDAMMNCTTGTFVSSFTCTNTEALKWTVIDASQSFFSGHAATCVYSCLFICWYLHKRVKSQSLFLIPFLQTTLICLAYYGSISRVFDHRHHWWDVLAGGIVGVLTMYHTVSSAMPMRKARITDERLFSVTCFAGTKQQSNMLTSRNCPPMLQTTSCLLRSKMK